MFYAMGPHITEKYIPSPKNTKKKITMLFFHRSAISPKKTHADLPSGMEKSPPPPIPELPSVQAVQAIEIPGHLESPWMEDVWAKKAFFLKWQKHVGFGKVGYIWDIWYIYIEHKYIYIFIM